MSQDEIAKRVREALERLGAQHVGPQQPTRSSSDADSYVQQPHAPSRHSQHAQSGYASAPSKNVSREDRALEGKLADIQFPDGWVTCYVHTVEVKAGKVKAYIMRYDTRRREYVTLDRLTNVRNDE